MTRAGVLVNGTILRMTAIVTMKTAKCLPSNQVVHLRRSKVGNRSPGKAELFEVLFHFFVFNVIESRNKDISALRTKASPRKEFIDR
jgi:hypothetical protein